MKDTRTVLCIEKESAIYFSGGLNPWPLEEPHEAILSLSLSGKEGAKRTHIETVVIDTVSLHMISR
jgi:hypothetical protein